MGHIELAAPVAHIWFLKSVPSRYRHPARHDAAASSSASSISSSFVVVEPGLTSLKQHELLTEELGHRYPRDESATTPSAVGYRRRGRACDHALSYLDLAAEREQMRADLTETELRGQAQEARQAPEAGRDVPRVRQQARSGWCSRWCRSSRPSCVRWCRSTAAGSRPRTSTTSTAASSTATTG